MHARAVTTSWWLLSKFFWLWVINDIRCGGRLDELVAGTGGQVSTKVVAPPFVEVDVLKGISKLV